jgi:Zn-dependent protease with chaperone function
MTAVNLYRAQELATQSVNDHWFERHKTTHISNCISTCVEAVESVLDAVASRIQKIVDALFSALTWICPCVGNTLYPINPINGKRHLVLLPRSIEEALGNALYSLITFGMGETSRTFAGRTSINQKVQEVFKKIKDANHELLYAQTEQSAEGYDYHVKVTRSSMVNAFACAGGGMVVFTGIIEEIRDRVNNYAEEARNVKVHFADGSIANVDLSDVSVDDVIAALLGHEMAHVASRHTLHQLALVLILTLVLNTIRGMLVGALGEDSLPNQLLLNLEDFILQYLLNSNSRVHEYEADVTGIEFMKKAGFNPLGALYLQEILTGMHRNGLLDTVHDKLEFLFTHPYGERRKRAIFAALSVLDKTQLQRTTRLPLAQTNLDTERASPAVCMASRIKQELQLRDN